MFRSYLLVAIRNFRQERFFTILNIAGLALGLASIILVGLWVEDELNYDKHFQDADRIYRIECSLITDDVPQPMAATDRRMARHLRQYYGHVCKAAAVYKTPTLLSAGGKTSFEENAYYADSSFFDIFSFEFIAGDGRTALNDSLSIVITDKLAKMLFGNNNAVGDTVWFNNTKTKVDMQPRIVTGVIKENRKASHFHPTVIFSKHANLDVFETVYISLHKGYTPAYFKEHIWQPYCKNIIAPNYHSEKQDMKLDRLQPLTSIHLGGNKWEDFESNGDCVLLYIFAAISFLILLLACINYVNLATARSFSRTGEIIVRKVLGATRRNIIAQFLIEALITSLVALLVAFSLVEMALVFFNDLADKQIILHSISTGSLLWIFSLTIIVGLTAGAYPAFFVSSFQPAAVMKDMQGSAKEKARLRQGLIIFQFSISIVMLIATITIRQQLGYVKKQDLGFDATNVLLVSFNDEKVYAEQESVKRVLRQNPSILALSATHNVPGAGLNHTYINFEQTTGNKRWLINSMFVDEHFPRLMGLTFVEGGTFDSSMKADTTNAYVIINESAKKQLGYDVAVGKKIDGGKHYGDKRGHIIGVVKDFHAMSLHTPIQPMALVLGTLGRPAGKSRYLMIKLSPGNTDRTINFIRGTYTSHGQGYPFHFTFLDQQFNVQYQKEEKQVKLFNAFTAISLFTSLLGLVGLATYYMKQRRKEICIRRISGASVTHIFFLLSKDYSRLIIIAWIIACPVSLLVLSQWLDTFAYHITLAPTTFFIAGGVVLIIVLLAVLVQTLFAVRLRPADVLRYS